MSDSTSIDKKHRKTVGSQYLEAQKTDTSCLTIGEIGNEMVKSLIDDINSSVESNPFDGEPFYINVVEERDLMMKNAIKRRLFVSKYRPYPEDNTLVFHVKPRSNEVRYCWDLPHHSELPNILANELSYPYAYTKRIREWMDNDLANFGFIKVSMNSHQIEGYDEKTIKAYRDAYQKFCDGKFKDPKDLESERRLGYFWIPNKFHQDELMENSKPKVFIV